MVKGQKFPDVSSPHVEEDRVRVEFFIPEELVYFDGHFPDFPIVPGVVQVNWVIHFLGEYLGFTCELTGIKVLKFNKMLRPGDRGELNIDWDSSSGTVDFTYSNDQEMISTGRLTLKQ